jgi:SAM-dependent methyltransferase
MLWEYPACGSCGKKTFSVVWDNITSWEHEGSFRLVKCSNCGLSYYHPRPTRSKIGQYYPKSSYWGCDVGKAVLNSEWREKRDKLFAPLYQLILKRKNKGTILDIGAGTGVFLSKFQELGWKVDGVELSKEAVNFSKKVHRVSLKAGDFLDYHFPKESFDVVTLNNSLEHLFSPLKTLKVISKVIKKGGIVVITVPNVNSLGLRIFGKKWYALQPPRHLYHFSPETLAKMLANAGFKALGTNHWYWEHNYYSFFESFRFFMSPRFKQKEGGGLASAEYRKRLSLKKETGKILIKLLSFVLTIIGSLTKKSEYFYLYAVKQE